MSNNDFPIRIRLYTADEDVKEDNESDKLWTRQSDGRLTTNSLSSLTVINSGSWKGNAGSDNRISTKSSPSTDSEWRTGEGGRIHTV